jgi:hypothetical protein
LPNATTLSALGSHQCAQASISARRLDENRWVACRRFIAAHDHIDVERVELDPATDAAGLVGSDEGRARAEEWVDDNVAAIGEVEERVLENGGRLDGRMVLEATTGVGAERRGGR